MLGLDVGEARIGVALASVIAQLPQPKEVILTSDTTVTAIQNVIDKENVTMVVIGLPRNLQGEETAQSQKIRDFADVLQAQISVPIVFADETLSSVRADDLQRNASYQNVSQDSLAACFILEEFLNNQQ